MLILVYTFNFVDRQIVGILAPAIKADLDLSDTQLAWMGGVAFALFYTTLGLPVARLADRWSRTGVMTIALALWSAMTALSGLAQSFWQLFLARMGVGVGEAGGVAPAYALIADYFPSHQRARALAVYSLGIPLGGGLAVGVGGVLAETLDWRAAFLIVGLAGVAIAPLFRLTVREPARRAAKPPAPASASGSASPPASAPTPAQGGPAQAAPSEAQAGSGDGGFGAVLALLRTKPSFWLLSLGAASASMVGYGLMFWLPSFFVRSFADTLPAFFAWAPAVLVPADAGPVRLAGFFYGAILLVGGTVGVLAGGILADRLGRTDRAAYARVPAVAFLAILPALVIGLLTHTPAAAFAAFLVLQALSLTWLGPLLSAFQHLVPATMRATASALFLLINNLIGLALGNLLIGALSDALAARFGAESLRYAMLSGAGLYLVAALLLLWAARHLSRDWHDPTN
ncbi:MFS transporter [Rhodothalassium salexigens]|uniref:spinster family MFS transporter n=1 Tax=Rhodothalassium salexigens TaxID=1086 RepID=UPI003211BC8F|nr:MFS transporter [Rhodothalassium salexigens]